MPHRTRGLHTTKKTPQVRRNTGTPCAMVYGLYVISPESGLVSLRRPPQISGGLDPSVGGPGQHDFARPPLAALVMRSGSVHRSPPHVRDDAFAPPIEAGCAEENHILPKNGRQIFFTRGLDSPSDKTKQMICPSCRAGNTHLWRPMQARLG